MTFVDLVQTKQLKAHDCKNNEELVNFGKSQPHHPLWLPSQYYGAAPSSSWTSSGSLTPASLTRSEVGICVSPKCILINLLQSIFVLLYTSLIKFIWHAALTGKLIHSTDKVIACQSSIDPRPTQPEGHLRVGKTVDDPSSTMMNLTLFQECKTKTYK